MSPLLPQSSPLDSDLSNDIVTEILRVQTMKAKEKAI